MAAVTMQSRVICGAVMHTVVAVLQLVHVQKLWRTYQLTW